MSRGERGGAPLRANGLSFVFWAGVILFAGACPGSSTGPTLVAGPVEKKQPVEAKKQPVEAKKAEDRGNGGKTTEEPCNPVKCYPGVCKPTPRQVERCERRLAAIQARRDKIKKAMGKPEPTCASVKFAEPCWLKAEKKDCHVWNPAPKPGESVTWSGGCKRGRISGNGTVIWNNGDIGSGRYTDGRLREGISWGEKVYMEGIFLDDGFEGVIAVKDGPMARGRVSDGPPIVLNGKRIHRDGRILEGKFVSGRPVGKIRRTLPDGIVQEGQWNVDRFVGEMIEWHRHNLRIIATRAGVLEKDGRKVEVAEKAPRYQIKEGSVWKDIDREEWEKQRSATVGPEIEAWGYKRASANYLGFRLTGAEARALYDSLALPETKEVAPNPTYNPSSVLVSKDDLGFAELLPNWTVKRARSTQAVGDSWYELSCFRWTRKLPPPPGAHDLCRIDYKIGPKYNRARVFYRKTPDVGLRILDVRDFAESKAASQLFDAMKGPGRAAKFDGRSVRRRLVVPTSGSWSLACHQFLTSDGKDAANPNGGGPHRSCRFVFAAPQASQQVEQTSWSNDR